MEMTIAEARAYVGKDCTVVWKDRNGMEQSTRLLVQGLSYVPPYGGYLLGEHWEELRSAMRPFDPIILAVVVLLIGFYIYRHIKHLRADNKKETG